MIVGFTGTREGMTEEQFASVGRLLHRLLKQNPGAEFWHGDEAHADTSAAWIAQDAGYWTVAWPGSDPGTRGPHVSDESQSPLPYLDRNWRIANGCDCIVATPKTTQELLRSGTWATVRYARQADKTVYIVQPDGRVDKEWAGDVPGSIVGRFIEHDIDLKNLGAKKRPGSRRHQDAG